MKRGEKLYGLIFFLFVLIMPMAFAQGFFDFLNFTDISSLYETSFEWWDFFIYFAIFGALGRIIFEKRFGGHKSADLLAVAVATALSLSLVYYERTVLGQSLIMLGGYPILITAAILLGISGFLWIKRKFGIIGGLVAALLLLILFPYILRGVGGSNIPSYIQTPLTDFGPVAIILLLIFLVLISVEKLKPRGSWAGAPSIPGGTSGGIGKGWNPFKRKPKQPKGQQTPQTPQQAQTQQANAQQIMQAVNNMRDHLKHIADRSAQLNILIGRVINDTKNRQASDPVRSTIFSVYNYRINKKSYDNIKRILSIIQNPGTKDADRKSALVLLENSLTDILNSAQRIMGVLRDINNPVDEYLRSKNVKFRIFLIARYIGQLCGKLLPYSQQIRSSIP